MSSNDDSRLRNDGRFMGILGMVAVDTPPPHPRYNINDFHEHGNRRRATPHIPISVVDYWTNYLSEPGF